MAVNKNNNIFENKVIDNKSCDNKTIIYARKCTLENIMKKLINKLHLTRSLSPDEFMFLLSNFTLSTSEYLFEISKNVAQRYFGNRVYIRGLIEFTNYCKNDCYYCGIRKSNHKVERYHLSFNDIMSCCSNGYALGFRTFVLQGGEDLSYSDDDICHIIRAIKAKYPNCAVTLSIGEKGYESYLKYYKAGVDRYLLRHETISPEHYGKLHPVEQSFNNRKSCLYNLKEIGFQTGTGFMVGSPYQTIENIVDDLLFIKEFQPEMIGIGPFIPHKDTPFRNESPGSLEMTLFLIGLIRLMLPKTLIPSTTALGTIHPHGREKGILAGANVVMPNLSPISTRKKYALYNNKICTDEEAAEGIDRLKSLVESIGYKIVVDRGDFSSGIEI